MSAGQRDERRRGSSHVFRPGSRASFLYPSWLNPSSDKHEHRAYLLRLWVLKLRLWLLQLLSPTTPTSKAQQAYLYAIIGELRLRELNEGDQSFQKSLYHQLRQNQLACFEKILAAYDSLNSPANLGKAELHPFPEIMLVMAKAIMESPPNSPELLSSARELMDSHSRLQSHLYQCGKNWSIPRLRLDALDPMICLLLEFRKRWSQFRHCRSLQIKRQAPTDNPALDSLSHNFNQLPPSAN